MRCEFLCFFVILSNLKSVTCNGHSNNAKLFFSKNQIEIVDKYKYLAFPIKLQLKKDLLLTLKSKLIKIESFKKTNFSFFSDGKKQFLRSLLLQLENSYKDILDIEKITQNTIKHDKRGFVALAARIGLKLISNLAKEIFPKHFIINSSNNRYLNGDEIKLHKIEEGQTKSHQILSSTITETDRLKKLINQTNEKIDKLEISATIIKLADEISKLQWVTRWLKDNIMKLVHTNRLPVNITNDKSITTEMESVEKKLMSSNKKLLNKNPYLMEATLGYDEKHHIIYIFKA